MKNYSIFAAAVGTVIVATFCACGSTSSESGTAETGASIYKSQCSTCHGSEGQGDLGPNITGSMTAGVGSWTAAQFAAAVRTGVDDEGETLCTGMTRFSTAVLSDDQLTKVHDYLLTQMNDTEHEPTGCP